MKKRFAMWASAVFLAFLILTAVGCTGAEKAAGDDTKNSDTGRTVVGETSEEAVIEMDKIEMTQTEKMLLIDTFGEEKRFEEGRLFRYHIEALDQLRAGMSYLQGRYPDLVFQYESFSPASRFRPWAELYFNENDRQSCLVKIRPVDNGASFVCEDNFYGLLLGEQYDAMIEHILAEAGCPARVRTTFIGTLGNDFPADAEVEDLIACDSAPSRQTAIYASESSPDPALAESIERTMNDNRIWGDFWIYYTGEPAGELKELEASSQQWESMTFHCYPEQ